MPHITGMTAPFAQMPDIEALTAANVNPATGLATDYLNIFNEYVMLAELAADGSLPLELLGEWQPFDYESHFMQSGFAGTKTVIAAFRALARPARMDFESQTSRLIEYILAHQADPALSASLLPAIRAERDRLAALISGPLHQTNNDQADIDILFD